MCWSKSAFSYICDIVIVEAVGKVQTKALGSRHWFHEVDRWAVGPSIYIQQDRIPLPSRHNDKTGQQHHAEPPCGAPWERLWRWQRSTRIGKIAAMSKSDSIKTLAGETIVRSAKMPVSGNGNRKKRRRCCSASHFTIRMHRADVYHMGEAESAFRPMTRRLQCTS